ncbi:MAG TPA: hypothetical protein VFM90_12865 [Cyclobacteriaceae bacterium]|nr:hypothetical protein [Cyclobacteriaceae bacterium]
MKKLTFLLVLISSAALAQKVKLVKGSLEPLKDQSAINVEFTYANMIVGKDLKEEDYINRKKTEYNEKEAGRGDTWEKAWVNDRAQRFEPQFIELFQKYSERPVNAEGKYTLVFHTIRTEPGFNVGVWREAARIDAHVLIVETSNRDNIIAELSVMNAPGRDAMGYDFDTGYRIQEAYSKSGKELGQLIVKQTKSKK